MSGPLVVRREFHFKREQHGQKQLQGGAEPRPAERIPRISRLMALAIHFEQVLRQHPNLNQSDLARLGRVSRARLTQIMNLLLLAPDIQEGLLFLPPSATARRQIRLQQLQPIAAVQQWKQQRKLWADLIAGS